MILFDGCSWTWGAELEDKETYRFSQLLSEMTNRDHVNLGQPSKSNNGILRTTLEYCERNPVDIAVIQFTGTSRTEIRMPKQDKYKSLSIGKVLKNSNGDDLSKIYYENIHNENEEISNFHKNKFLLEYYFKSKNIPYYFVNINRNPDKLKGIEKDVVRSSWYYMMDKEPTQSLVELLGVRNKKYYCQGRQKDSDKRSRGHPNILGHKVIAEYIYENFLNKYASVKI